MEALNASAQIPAVCDHCGTVFPSGIALGMGASVRIEDVGAGPCPKCGGRGSIPDGLYEFAGEAQRVLSNWSPERQQHLAAAIESARQAPEPRAAVTAAIAQDPDLAALAKRLLIPSDANQFWAFVATLIAILGLLVGTDGDVTINKSVTINKTTGDPTAPGNPPEQNAGTMTKKPPPPPNRKRAMGMGGKRRR